MGGCGSRHQGGDGSGIGKAIGAKKDMSKLMSQQSCWRVVFVGKLLGFSQPFVDSP